MSKKRNKNQRKKQVQKRGVASRSSSPAGTGVPHGGAKMTSRLEQDYQAPSAEAPGESGGGAIGAMRHMMSHGEEGDSASLLHKRRSCSEMLLWVVGGAAVFWLITKFVVIAFEAGQKPSL
jgi:hypothetical protein